MDLEGHRMKLSLRFKLVGAFLFVALLVVVAGGVGLVMSQVLVRAGDKVAREMAPTQYVALKAAQTLGRLNERVLQFAGTRTDFDAHGKAVSDAMTEFHMWLMMPLLGTDSDEFKKQFGKTYSTLNLNIHLSKAPSDIEKVIQVILGYDKEINSALDELSLVQKRFSQYIVIVDGDPVHLDDFSRMAYLDYLNWTADLQDAISIGAKFELTTDPKASVLGKWLYSSKVDDKDLADILGNVKKYHEKVFKVAAEVNATTDSAAKASLFNNAKVSKLKLEGFLKKFNELSKSKVKSLVGEKTNAVNTVTKKSQLLLEKTDELLRNVDQGMGAAISDAGQAKALVGVLLPVITVLAVFLALVIGLWMSGIITKAVFEVSRVMMGVASGDLREKAKVTSEDEVGDLARNVNSMVDGLVALVGQVKQSAGNLVGATGEISSSAQQIADGAQQQSASFEELSSSVQSNAENAKSASALSQEAVQETLETRQVMDGTIEAMTAIEKRSSQMSEAVDLITEIADQTNLLALNAAIEAARAGEHGKGFAVVADEVRSLAERSATSAKEIATLIKCSVEDIGKGVEISRKAGENTNRVIAKINQVADQLKQVAETTQEQAAAMEENTSITETNASAAEELAATAEKMTSQAEELRSMVEQFRVDGDAGAVSGVNDELFVWNSSFETGVSEMDAQHVKLVGMVNDLYRAMRQQKAKEVMNGIVDGLISYTAKHFKDEEAVMERASYPDIAKHKEIHVSLVNKVLEVQKNLHSGQGAVGMDLLNFLKDWLVKHIKGTDKKYGVFITKSPGGKPRKV
jgi:hemerythrin-like metal-binding protein